MTERMSQVDVLRAKVLSVHGGVVASIDAVGQTLRGGARPALVGVRRAFQTFARLPAVAQPYALGISHLGEHRKDVASSLAHVGTLTSMMARRAGMPSAIQRDVGVAASMSSIARALNPSLANLSPDECVERKVYALSARWLMRAPGMDPFKELLVIVASEQVERETRVRGHLVSQLTAVADRYSAMMNASEDGAVMQTHQALDELAASPDVSPAAVRLLALTIGTYPVGTAVRLSTGELAVVVAPNPSINVEDPRVAIMRERSGQMADGRVVDIGVAGATITDVVDMTQLQLGAGELMLF